MGAERGRIPELAPGHLCAAMPSVMECASPVATELTDVTFRAQGFYWPSSQGSSAVAQIGEPVRRYTVIPLEEPVSPLVNR